MGAKQRAAELYRAYVRSDEATKVAQDLFELLIGALPDDPPEPDECEECGPIVRWMLVLESGAGELFYPDPVSKNLKAERYAGRLFKLVDAEHVAKRLRDAWLEWVDIDKPEYDLPSFVESLARELEADGGN